MTSLHLPAAQIGSSIIIRSHAARRRRRGASRQHLRQHLPDLERRADTHGVRPVEPAQLKTSWGAVISSDSPCSTRMEICWPVPSGTDNDIHLDGREGWMAGIGAVFTPVEARGRGHASRLIELLVERERAAGALLAGLFSEIGAGSRSGLDSDRSARRGDDYGHAERRLAGDARALGRGARPARHRGAMHAARTAGVRFALRRDPPVIHYALTKKRLLAGLSPWPAPGRVLRRRRRASAAAARFFLKTRMAGRWRRQAIAIRPGRASARCCRC